MHYVAIIQGEERQVEITELSPDKYAVTIDGRKVEVDARQLGSHSMSVLIGDDAHSVELERAEDSVNVGGHVIPVEVLDLRKMRLRRAQESAANMDGPAKVAAPMPGKVVAVLVKEGQEVQAGTGLVVIEAMKMENELRAPKAGTVRKLTATLGAAVDNGAALCVID
jgi:biotin carboxyl carrier protein